MKLSEKLSNYRCDRPDEYTMDEFKRNAIELESQLAKNKSIVKKVDADNLPEGTIFIVIHGRIINGSFTSKYIFTCVDGEKYLPTHYIEQKDLIEWITGAGE